MIYVFINTFMYLERISLQRKVSYVVGVKYPEWWESWFSFGESFRVKFSRKTFRLAPVDGTSIYMAF